MIKKFRTNRIIPFLLLTIISSHLFVFHFEMEEKFLCIGEGNHFHIESMSNTDLGYQQKEQKINNKVAISEYYHCTDIPMDNHVDEDFVKFRKIVFFKKVETINTKNIDITNSTQLRRIANRYNNLQKIGTELLSTVQLLI